MPIIEAHNLVKVFERTRRAEGRFATIRTLVTRRKDRTVAVDGVSLSIDEGSIVTTSETILSLTCPDGRFMTNPLLSDSEPTDTSPSLR